MNAAPVGQFPKLTRSRKPSRADDVQLDARRQRDAPPKRTRGHVVAEWLRRPGPRLLRERHTNVVQRVPALLQRLDAKELLEMFRGVVIASTQSERRRDETFLDVIANRPPRYAAQRLAVTCANMETLGSAAVRGEIAYGALADRQCSGASKQAPSASG